MIECSERYLGNDIKAIAHLVQRLPKPSPIVSSIELSEPEQRMLLSPHPLDILLNPMPSDREISISIGGLPCVTCQAYFAGHSRALISNS